ncbi:LamG domain-containing protein [Paenibacillus bouchesdurhonensis]|uniref:hypothetical protein n=1 Tax=Paenibacillus bouchesdurhonensis TaxID=1870990 RepID=UPI000DA60C56|nr:hypothetical protein [Paenibacillus bouchesdurhonensis]
MKKKIVLAILIALMAAGCSEKNAPSQASQESKQENTWVHTFAKHDPTKWEASTGYSNGDPFDCVWSSENILFNGSTMELMLTKNDTGNIQGSEYKTLETLAGSLRRCVPNYGGV